MSNTFNSMNNHFLLRERGNIRFRANTVGNEENQNKLSNKNLNEDCSTQREFGKDITNINFNDQENVNPNNRKSVDNKEKGNKNALNEIKNVKFYFYL